MNRKGILALAALAVLVLAAGLLHGRRAQPAFNGSRVCNDGEFAMEYTAFNGTERCDFVLNAGDAIDVSIEREGGSVSVSIAVQGEEPIYCGTDMETACFTVGVLEPGTYTITVTGEWARGSVRFAIQSPVSDGAQAR